MDDPINEIRDVVLSLTTGSRRQQQETLESFFTRDASFKHPFCAVAGNRDAILSIFQWYKILSPKIEIEVNSVAFDETNLILYLHISQTFRIWFIPFYAAAVNLTTILHLVPGSDVAHTLDNDKYFIRSQEDLYQTDEWIKFLLPFHIGVTIVGIWHWIATLCCIVGAKVVGPFATAFASVKQVSVDADAEGEAMFGGDGTMEAIEVEQRRDSKRVKEGHEERRERMDVDQGTLHKMEMDQATWNALNGKEVDEGTVRAKEKANGEKSVREMERKANLGETK